MATKNGCITKLHDTLLGFNNMHIIDKFDLWDRHLLLLRHQISANFCLSLINSAELELNNVLF